MRFPPDILTLRDCCQIEWEDPLGNQQELSCPILIAVQNWHQNSYFGIRQ